MTVIVKCRYGHEFEVTEDMFKPMDRAGMLRVECPICNMSVILSFTKIGEIIGTDVNGAKAYGFRLQNANPMQPKKIETPAKVISRPEIKVDQISPKIVDKNEVEDIMQRIDIEKERVESEFIRPRPAKIMDDVVERDQVVSHGTTPFEDEFEKTPSDILESVLNVSQLDQTAKDDLCVYFRLRNFNSPTEGWQPKEVQSVLESYGIPKTIALKVSNRYQFLLDTWTKKRNAASNLIGMLGDPAASFMFPGDRGASGMYPYSSSPGSSGLSGPGSLPGVGTDTRQLEMQMVQAYQMNPQGFFSWLAYNPQYIQVWQRVVQSNPLVTSGMPISMGMGMGMGMGMPSMGTRGNSTGISRDEVKRMVGTELDNLKLDIRTMLGEKTSRDENKHLIDALLQIVKDTQQHRSDPAPQKPDEAGKFIATLADKLLAKQLEQREGDPFMYQLVEEVKELKKSLGEGTSFKKSMEDFEQYLKLQQLQFEMGMKKQEFDDKGKNREFIKSAVEKGIGAISEVVMQLQQRQSGTTQQVEPPVQVSGVKTENTVTLPCNNCGTHITFPKSTKNIVCPACNAEYEAVPVPEPTRANDLNGFVLPHKRILANDSVGEVGILPGF